MTKIIWDSGFGWDLANYVRCGSLNGEIRIMLLTGKRAGFEICVPEREIRPYDDLVIEEMKYKYKYDQTIQMQN